MRYWITVNLLGHMEARRFEAMGPGVVDGIVPGNARGAARAHDSVISPDVKGVWALGLRAQV